MRNGIIGSLFALGLTVTSAAAQAQDPEAGEVSAETTTTTVTTTSTDASGPSSAPVGARGPLRLYGGFHFGGGGNWKTMPEKGDSNKADLAGLIGFQLGADYVMHKYFAIGGEFRLTSTALGDRPDGVDRSDVSILLIDFTAKPRGRYEFSNIPLEVYGTLPLGFSVVNPEGDDNAKFNMNFGLGGGATYFFTDHIGVNAELDGIFHWYRNKIENPFTDDDFKVRNRLGQFYTFLNFVYVL